MKIITCVCAVLLLLSNVLKAEEVAQELKYVPDEQGIKETEDFIGAIYRRFYDAGEIRIEIMNEPEEALEIKTRETLQGEKGQYLEWHFKIWYNDIMTMKCFNHGEPQMLNEVCTYNQEIEVHVSRVITKIYIE